MANIVNQEVEFGDIVRGLKKLEGAVARKGEEIVTLRFEQGCLLKDVVGKAKYGEGAVERIAKESKIAEPTLRIAFGHAKRFRFKRELLDKQIDELKEAGKSISYGYFRAALKEDSNPEVHGSPEKHKEHLLKKAENLGEVIHEASVHYPNDEEVVGAAIGAAEVIQEAEFVILGDHGKSGIKKGAAWRNDAYRAFVRGHGCIVCGKTEGVEAHHLIYKSRGGQGTDLSCVPICNAHHTGPDGYHALGRAKFEERYNIDFNPVVIDLIERFITEVLK